jgi:hypothetical protein
MQKTTLNILVKIVNELATDTWQILFKTGKILEQINVHISHENSWLQYGTTATAFDNHGSRLHDIHAPESNIRVGTCVSLQLRIQ